MSYGSPPCIRRYKAHRCTGCCKWYDWLWLLIPIAGMVAAWTIREERHADNIARMKGEDI